MILLASVLIEHLFLYREHHTLSFFSYSSLTTAMGILMMLVAPSLWIYLSILFLGLFQKHMIGYKHFHFFNPSNFALMMGMLIFYRDAHMVMGQLGDAFALRIGVVVAAVLILYRVDRWLIPVVFSLSYLLFQYFWVVSYDPVLLFEDVYERFYSVSFILFVLFMLTDPRTTPPIWWQQALFAVAVSMVAVGLDRLYGFRIQHLFMALFLLSPFHMIARFHKDHGVWARTLLVVVLALSVIIYIEIQPPYYYEMNR